MLRRFGILGRLLEIATGQQYEPLLHATLIAPLRLRQTAITLSPAQWADQVAPGVNATGGFAERNTPYGIMKGQGAYHSDIGDMVLFVSTCLTIAQGELASTTCATKLYFKKIKN